MAFDAQAFGQLSYKPRTAEVDAKALKDWFDKGDKPVFVVRGLTGIELSQVAVASRQGEMLREMVSKLATGSAKEKAEVLAREMGISEDRAVPDAYDQSIERLIFGLVEPKLDRDAIVKLFSVVPGIAYACIAKINDLTEQGADLGKPKRSTKTTALEVS